MRIHPTTLLIFLALPALLMAQEAQSPTPRPGPAAASAEAAKPADSKPADAKPADATPAQPLPVQPGEPGIVTGTRIFGVLPNYKTVEKMTVAYKPLTAYEKFVIATHDSFDSREFMLAAALTELNMLSGQDPEWGQGVKGFAKRYGASLADQTISNYLTEAALPVLFHEDPRYFRLGGSNHVHRVVHALSWIIINKDDNGHTAPNFAEQVGSFSSAAIGWYYYPTQERLWSQVANRFITQISFDAASSVLKEYWPDIRHKFFHKD
jgi:hypothetical protein